MVLPDLTTVLSPFPILETNRLILRQIQSTDAPEILALFSDEDVLQYHDLAPLASIENAAHLIQYITRRYQNCDGIRWAITLKTGDDTLVGTGGLNRINAQAAIGTLGYDLLPAYWNQGYITEAVRAFMRFGFAEVGLNRIEAQTMLWNVASMRVLHKLGFKEEGILREWGYWKGEYHDLCMLSLLRREYGQPDLDS